MSMKRKRSSDSGAKIRDFVLAVLRGDDISAYGASVK